MNISSVDKNSWWYYLQATTSLSGTSGTTNGSSQASSSSSQLAGVQGINADGDTFQLSGSVQANAGQYGPPPLPAENGTSAGSSATQVSAEMFSQLDTDGDGALSETEFAAARPDDVSEEMAANLYNSLDSDGSGSLTASELSALNGKA